MFDVSSWVAIALAGLTAFCAEQPAAVVRGDCFCNCSCETQVQGLQCPEGSWELGVCKKFFVCRVWAVTRVPATWGAGIVGLCQSDRAWHILHESFGIPFKRNYLWGISHSHRGGGESRTSTTAT